MGGDDMERPMNDPATSPTGEGDAEAAADSGEFPPEAIEEARRLNDLPEQDPEESTGIDV
jgi:hypothetical protein